MKYSISKREKNKIYYTSIKVKKHEEKHSKLGRPKNFKRNLKKKKKIVTIQNCHAPKKKLHKKNQARTKKIQKKREKENYRIRRN